MNCWKYSIIWSIYLIYLFIYLPVCQWTPSCWISVVFRHSCQLVAVLGVKFLCFVTLCTSLPVVLLVVLLQVPVIILLFHLFPLSDVYSIYITFRSVPVLQPSADYLPSYWETSVVRFYFWDIRGKCQFRIQHNSGNGFVSTATDQILMGNSVLWEFRSP